LGQLTIEEEQQNQSNIGNENEFDNVAYNDGDNSENPWKKGSQTQQETTIPATSSKPGIYVAPGSLLRGGDVMKPSNFFLKSLSFFNLFILFFCYDIEF
jgi:hypothetical protein